MSLYVALVIGSTGAVGRDLVAELVSSSRCTKVIALTRRDIPESMWTSVFPSMDCAVAAKKLTVRKVDFDRLSDSDLAATDKVDAVFSCLGTTRKDAGSGEAFRKVDLKYVHQVAELAKTAGVPYFGLLTSQGANKDSWFLYPQTKGEVEDKVQQLQFDRWSVFRPGMLQRGDLLRGTERMFGWMIPGISVKAVAKAMVHDYENGNEGIKEWSHADLKTFE
ncbi:unnamed protein product [Hyaloperonospora brassicae]|uniref:NAD(P)-binding domain-containing protein n=1 Tax=Hyaloperonospora brassicae TaxID=162125 RepID=A0AAV0TND1_HYABA|nr:unnamed protein product [Hyaloperonospora brassicae]